MHEKLETLLKKKNVTAYKMGKETGIPMTSVYDWMSGRSKPKIDNLVKLSTYFGVDLSYFVGDK